MVSGISSTGILGFSYPFQSLSWDRVVSGSPTQNQRTHKAGFNPSVGIGWFQATEEFDADPVANESFNPSVGIGWFQAQQDIEKN